MFIIRHNCKLVEKFALRNQRTCNGTGLIAARQTVQCSHVKSMHVFRHYCRTWLKRVEKRHNPIITQLTPTVVLQMPESYLCMCIAPKIELKFSLARSSSLLWRPFVYESHFACFNVVNQSSQSDQFCSITAPYEVCRKRSGRPDINNPDGEIITFWTGIKKPTPLSLARELLQNTKKVSPEVYRFWLFHRDVVTVSVSSNHKSTRFHTYWAFIYTSNTNI